MCSNTSTSRLFIMYRIKIRFLFTLLFVILLCSAAQATNLQISVQDSLDNSSVSHATVFINGINQGRTTNTGNFSYPNDGLHNLDVRVSMAGYDSWEQIVDANTTFLLVNLSRQTLTLKVTLYDSDTLNPISGASVNISAENQTQGKTTDATGSAIFGVQGVTLYSVYITAPNYQPRSDTVDMESANNEVQYYLLSGNRYSVVVKDNDTSVPVPGAEVRVDGTLLGTTDARGILITPITRGMSHTIAVTSPGYQTFTETKMIGDTDALETIGISKAPVGAFIFVTDENRAPLAGADVYINGSLMGTTNQYGRSDFPGLLSGSYPVEVRKSGYVTVSRQIEVSNQSQDYDFEMPFESAVLTLFVQENDQKVVSNATITINGQLSGVTDDHGQYVTKVTLNTLNNVTATKDGYQPSTIQEQVIQGNATASATITMIRTLDWGLITLIGFGAIGVLVLFAAIRMFGRRKRRHVMRRNEI